MITDVPGVMDIVYTVLYTHQKRKKAKTWQDGTLKVLATGTKAVLYDDKGSKLDVVHIHASDVITGEQLESDRYYIQVEEIQKKSTPQTADTQASSAQYPQNSCPMAQPKAAQSQPLKAVTTQNAGPSNEGSGLKRKRSGFIPPRVVRPRTAENDAPCLDNIQPKVSSAFTPHNGSSSHLFGTVSSLPSDNSSEKLSPSALFSAGRTRNGASVDTPPDFFKTSDSPQSKPQASLLTKSSPWRTIGSGLSKTSPVGHHLSPGQTVTVEGKEQSVSRDAQSPWNRDKPGATSVLPSLSPSQESFNKTTEVSKSLLGNRVQLGLNAPLGKRSASEIMALLGKKKHEVAVMRTANTCSNSEKSSALQNFGTVAQIADQEPRSVVSNESGLSCTSDTTRVEEMEFQNTFTNENDHNKDRLQKSSPNIYVQDSDLKANPSCSKTGIWVDGANNVTHCTPTASENSETAVNPKLSASTLSLSKYDFEMAECFDGESLSSNSAAVGFADSMVGEHSQNLSDSDFSQTSPQADLKDEEKESEFEGVPEWSDTNAVKEESVGVIYKQNRDLDNKNPETHLTHDTEPASQLKGYSYRNVGTERHSQGGETLQLNCEADDMGEKDIHCSETAVDDLDACFEMSFSPLSEVCDSEGGTSPKQGEELWSNENLDPDKTTGSLRQQLIDSDVSLPLISTVSALGSDAHQNLPSEEESDILEGTLDPTTKQIEGQCTHAVTNTVKLCQKSDVLSGEADPAVNSLVDEGTLSAGKVRLGDCASHYSAQGSRAGSVLLLETMEDIPASQSENVKTSQPLSMEQDTSPGVLNSNAASMTSLNTNSRCISSNMPDSFQTVNDLHLSPDSFVPPQLLDQSPEPPSVSMQTENEEGIQSSCGAYPADDKQNLHWLEDQKCINRPETGLVSEAFHSQVEGYVVIGSSASSSDSFPTVVSAMSSPPPSTSCIVADSPVSDIHPLVNVSEHHSKVDRDVYVQSTAYHSFKTMNESVENITTTTVSPPNLHQIHSCPRNLQYNHNMDSHQFKEDSLVSAAYSLPVHRPFQTVSEVLCERPTNATFRPFCDEDPGAVLDEGKTEKKSQVYSFGESLTSDKADLESGDGMDVLVSSPLPHPDRLVRNSVAEVTTHGNCSTTTTSNIAEAISARLTGYKMQGMVASGMVQRPMAYRREIDHRQPLPWISTPSAGPYNSRDTSDQKALGAGKNGFHPQTSGAVETSESHPFPLAGDALETSSSSLFIDCDEGKPFFMKSRGSEQMKLCPDGAQQVPVLTDAVTLLRMTSMSSQQSGSNSCNVISTQYSHSPNRQIYSTLDAVDFGHHRPDYQNIVQHCFDGGFQTTEVKKDCVMKNNIDEDENVDVSVGDDLQTVGGQCMEWKSVPVSCNEPASVSREDSMVSPLLFPQYTQSRVSTISVNCTQRRNRKLVPVVTDPEEVATKGTSPVDEENEITNRIVLEGADLMCKTATPSEQEVNNLPKTAATIIESFPLNTYTSDSLTSFADVHPPAQSGKEVKDSLLHGTVENLDFSGFTDSFPDSDQGEYQVLGAFFVTTAGECVSQLKGERNVEDGEQQKDVGPNIDSALNLVFKSDESVCRKTDLQKVRQSNSLEDMCSTSTASSPGIVIANDGLDYGEELEDDSVAAKQDNDQSHIFLTEQNHNMKDVQRQKKISRFASQFQTLHPHMHPLGKENLSGISPGKSNTKVLKANRRACEPHSDHFQRVYKHVAASAAVLSPAAPTNSPPLDISPNTNMEDTNRNWQCQTVQQSCSSTQCSTNASHFHPDRLRNRHPASHTDLEASRVFQHDFYQEKYPKQTGQICSEDDVAASGGSSVSQCVLKEAVTRNTATARTVGLGKFRRPGVTTVSGCLPNSQFQSSLCHELQFCGREEVERQATPVRQVVIPPSFLSVVTYKQILTASLTEFLNIQLFTVAKMYHCALSKVDLSAYIEGVGTEGTGGSSNPACKCGSASKVAQVKKEGPNKGRFFYACSAPRDKQCKFFQWVDQQSGSSASRGGGSSSTSMTRPKFSDPASIMGYFRGQGLVLHCQCQFVRRTDNPAFKFGFHKWARPQQSDSVQKKNVFIKLLKKDSAATHAKDDLWVVSKSLRFAKGETFVARSTFHGPNTHGEVAVDPVAGYSASLWTDGSVCHAVHCGNAATELTCMANIQDHVDTTSLPLLPHLLSCQPGGGLSNRAGKRGFKVPTVQQTPEKLYIPAQFVLDLAAEFITRYQLNGDQAQAVRQAASMMDKDNETPSSILLIHGVFGAGKSFLLSVMILFLVEVFQRNDSYCPGVPFPWKLLLSSTTNVAVDRVLLGLMELGFDDFVRVGSVKKIAKPVLPYSMHASGSDNQELKDLQEMLKSQDITSAEKHCIRRSIERHRLGENRKRLGAVHVVGVTCAACSFQCLDKMKFPFVILDECSQMTEPASLLPIARSACEKLVLVGDPKQLDPTLQGSEAAHGEGLEQTLLDRLIKMGHSPVMLRTQYRCHPTISAVSNSLFYQGQLVDGVSADTRQPVLDLFPTLCFYDVSNGEEMTDSSGSFTNEAEAQFVGLLLSVIMVHGLQPASVGVITLYKAQARRILDIIRHSKGDAQQELIGVQVSTVDAFQGGERDIIILSCVRTRSVGFIDSDKRMNVALTRARHHMLIVGHQKNLYGNKRWAQVLSHCQAVVGGVVSAISARRQLQAAMDRMQEEDQHSMSCEPPDQGAADQPQPKAARKRKATFQKGSAEDLTARDKSSPPKSKTSSPALYVESEDTPCSSSDQLEASLVWNVNMEEENTMPETPGDCEGSSPEIKPRRSKAGRVKPLVIMEEEDKAADSSDDDFLPDGLV